MFVEISRCTMTCAPLLADILLVTTSHPTTPCRRVTTFLRRASTFTCKQTPTSSHRHLPYICASNLRRDRRNCRRMRERICLPIQMESCGAAGSAKLDTRIKVQLFVVYRTAMNQIQGQPLCALNRGSNGIERLTCGSLSSTPPRRNKRSRTTRSDTARNGSRFVVPDDF
jgi:hypothetical protein